MWGVIKGVKVVKGVNDPRFLMQPNMKLCQTCLRANKVELENMVIYIYTYTF